MGNEMFQARLPDNFAKEIHEFREDNHMNKSEAVRHLLRAGLEAETDDITEPADTGGKGTPLERLASRWTVLLGSFVLMLGGILSYFGFYLALNGSTILGPGIVALGGIVVGAGFGLLLLTIVAEIATTHQLPGLVGLGVEEEKNV